MKTVELASRILTQLGFYQEPSRELGVDDRRDNIVHLIEEYTTTQTNDGCGNCHACLVGVTENGLPVTFQRMILCPDCGNKRCPKTSNHRHHCTGSNEPNQRGSIYTTPQTKPLSDEEIINIIDGTDWRGTEEKIRFNICRAIEERHGIK